MRQNICPIILGRPGWVLPGAAIDRFFSRGLRYGPTSLTVTRASSQADYAETTGGVWLPFQPNVARITDRGLLAEESRTNSLRNNSMTGASAPSTIPTNWSSTGDTGLTLTVNGVGTENGIDYIEIRLNGTTNATSRNIFFEDNSVIAAAATQIWTSSTFFSIVGGDLTNVTTAVVRVWEYFGTTAVQNSGTSVATATAALSRFQVTRTFTDGTTDFTRGSITFTFSSGVAVDVTFRIGWPQLEQGSFATSPIRTTSAAVTRASDVAIISNLVFGPAYSLFGSGYSFSPGTATGVLAQIYNTGNDRFRLQRIITTNVTFADIISGGVSQSAPTALGAWDTNVNGKFAGAVTAGDAAISFNGSAVNTSSPTLMPVGPNKIVIGSNGAAAFWNGYITRVAAWPATRISNAQLQAITS
jgi:hypothetical protein